MTTYTQILYQIVYSTKDRKPVLKEKRSKELYKYFFGILKNNKCHVYRINGIEDHIHIVTHLHPIVALARLIKNMKIASSVWIKEGNIFPGFTGWQVG